MRKILAGFTAFVLFAGIAFALQAGKFKQEELFKNIHWIHHSAFRIELNGKVIYTDPWQVKNIKQADYIFVTHDHYDHFSLPDIKALLKKGGVVICPQKVADKLGDIKHITVNPGDKLKLDGLNVEVVPAYNIIKPFHPKSAKYVGYILDIAGLRIYHAGDTDVIPEMKSFKDITVAMLPIGGVYTMNGKEAGEAANDINPVFAVPMHYGKIVGGPADLEAFKKSVKQGITVVVPKQEE